MSVYIHTHYIQIYICKYVCKCVCMYLCACACAHAHTHIHTHLHTCSFSVAKETECNRKRDLLTRDMCGSDLSLCHIVRRTPNSSDIQVTYRSFTISRRPETAIGLFKWQIRALLLFIRPLSLFHHLAATRDRLPSI